MDAGTVHDVVIEIPQTLRSELERDRYAFPSAVGSEAVAHQVEAGLVAGRGLEAPASAVSRVRGTWAIAAFGAGAP